MARKINETGREKIKQWEELVLYTYDDADASRPKKRIKAGDKHAGTLTIGYGHTSHAGAPLVVPGMEMTEWEAEQVLIRDLSPIEKRVELLVKVPLNDNQFSTLVSFEMNTGALEKSTLLKKLNAGDYDAVPSELAKWVKTTINGKKVRSNGLVNRRAAEAGLWAKGSEVASASTTAIATGTPMVTKENITFGAGLLASLAALFDGTGPVQWVLGGVIGVSFIFGLVIVLQNRFRPR
jgi:lysozyme